MRVNAVLVVKVDRVNAEAFQAGLAGSAHVLRLAAHTAHMGIEAIAHNSEFRGQKYPFAEATNGLAHKQFVVSIAVDIGRVEKRNAEFDGAMDCGNGFGVVPRAIEFRHTHATKAKGGDERTISPELTHLHRAPRGKYMLFWMSSWRPRIHERGIRSQQEHVNDLLQIDGRHIFLRGGLWSNILVCVKKAVRIRRSDGQPREHDVSLFLQFLDGEQMGAGGVAGGVPGGVAGGSME